MLPDDINELEYLLTWKRGVDIETHFLFHNDILYELVIDVNGHYGFRKYIKDINDKNHFLEKEYYRYEMYKYETFDIVYFLMNKNKIVISDGNVGRDMILKKYNTIVRRNKISKLLNN